MPHTPESIQQNFSVSDTAVNELAAFMGQDENNGKALRLYFAGNGCSGPRLGFALESPNVDEAIYNKRGVTIQADQETMTIIESYGGVSLDFVDDPVYGSGFRADFKNPPEGGCGSSCGSGGCGC
ncbi:MAG: hypothetical protein C4523_13855 [Myxococcales bacterium]|nr:MAG: hypothetical protein C4523_13855 [Myxococcales bacterium]